ncbi:glycosyltransferase family 4 protein [Calothrix sp. PCC 6303]|uniref:glycosyltransferase family 4 protein n=1 Tax=Calothrix sp. PCC 6303 TaxID=1170562 RepID=UPI0002A0593C|nr:glycosyltransferase family 4 protein [Calothrix sp. PCC 6303]AFZ00163.1 glycosyl transferase group 1 [Calothrix sp. PCC 6303]
MKKILMVATIPATLRAFLLPFAQHFRNQGWQVDAIACGISACDRCHQVFDRVWDVEWSRNPLDPRNFLKTPSAIQEIVTRGQYDIVHVHTPVAAFVTRYALRNLRKQLKTKVIYTAHGFHFHPAGKPLKNAVFRSLEKFAGNWTDYLVVINHEDEAAAKRHQLVSPQHLCYMPGIGVDLDYYNPDKISDREVEEVRQELGLTAETQLLLSVAELIPRKHPEDVLRAFAKLAKSEVCLAFAGDGPLMDKMQELTSELGVQKQVRFLGLRQDIPTLMRVATATLLASEQEGLPRCVMESMSLGTPVIGTSIRGTQDLLKDGCGFLVEVGDVEGLSNAIAYVLDNPIEAGIVAQRGRDRMAVFELEQVIKLHDQLYAEALSV